MKGKRLIRTLRLQNLLSFGPDSKEFTLEPLNILIGPNASGKSNLIEAIGLLAAAAYPGDKLARTFRNGGGISEWLWKGCEEIVVANIETTVDFPNGTMPLRYWLHFTMTGQRLEIMEEGIANQSSTRENEDTSFLYRGQDGRVVQMIRTSFEEQPPGKLEGRKKHVLKDVDGLSSSAALSWRGDPNVFLESDYLATQFSRIKVYREWTFGPRAESRKPVPADLPGDFFDPETNNLSLVINDLEHRGALSNIIGHLKKFYEEAENITTRILGGTVQLFIHEKGLAHPIPASRLSDGTLRYLCLLTILCHPSPPPLVCIEEPELGLHPDIIPTIAELLVEASQRTQLVVTTHSDLLVSALSETPEAVVVCEHDQDGTQLRRLEPEKLKKWLEKYSLGELWTKGEIGGTRW